MGFSTRWQLRNKFGQVLIGLLVIRKETSFAVCSTDDKNIAYDSTKDPQIFNIMKFLSLLINLKLTYNEMNLNFCNILAVIIFLHE